MIFKNFCHAQSSINLKTCERNRELLIFFFIEEKYKIIVQTSIRFLSLSWKKVSERNSVLVYFDPSIPIYYRWITLNSDFLNMWRTPKPKIGLPTLSVLSTHQSSSFVLFLKALLRNITWRRKLKWIKTCVEMRKKNSELGRWTSQFSDVVYSEIKTIYC